MIRRNNSGKGCSKGSTRGKGNGISRAPRIRARRTLTSEWGVRYLQSARQRVSLTAKDQRLNSAKRVQVRPGRIWVNRSAD